MIFDIRLPLYLVNEKKVENIRKARKCRDKTDKNSKIQEQGDVHRAKNPRGKQSK